MRVKKLYESIKMGLSRNLRDFYTVQIHATGA